jgi:hypothetical protein
MSDFEELTDVEVEGFSIRYKMDDQPQGPPAEEGVPDPHTGVIVHAEPYLAVHLHNEGRVGDDGHLHYGLTRSHWS